MRKSVKYRLIFLFIAIVSYYLGFNFIPESTTSSLGLYPVILASVLYFAILPILYWFMIIKAGKQKAWKLLIILSLSSAIARYSYPEDIAQYFDFILWLRYPIMAILLIIELYLIVIIVKGLWQARNLSGDPRIGAIEKYDDDKKQGLALTFATEPASWYYAIPRLSKRHTKSLGKIILWSGKAWHFLMVSLLLITIALTSYQLLIDWSETAAIMAATFILYSFILLTANYRLSRHYSIYIQDEKLIINNSIFNFMVIPLDAIKSVSTPTAHDNETEKSSSNIEKNDVIDPENDSQQAVINNEQLKIGRGKQHNINITFKQPIKYWGMMGSFVESFEQVLINVEQPTEVINALAQINSPQQQVA
ncbi:MAG: hypothetical protein WBC60_18525 [Cognaticolwellia sp.]